MADMDDSPRSRCPRSQKEGGTILLLVVVIVMLIWIIVADTTLVARVELEATMNADQSLIMEMAVRGGYQIALAHLRDDLEAGDIDSLQDGWALPDGIEQVFNPTEMGAGPFIEQGGDRPAREIDEDQLPKVKIFIQDEDRKWPLNILTKGAEARQKLRLQGLISVLDGFREDTIYDLDSGTASEYATLIFDFIKREDSAQDGGFGPTPRPLTKTGSILRITDLALIPGIAPETIYDQVDIQNGRVAPGLMHVLTVWSDLVINVNTAPRCVLRGLFRQSDATVGNDIFEHREKSYVELGEERDRQERTGSAGRASTDPGSEEQEEGDLAGGPFQEVDDVQKNVATVTTQIFTESRTLMSVRSSTFSIWVEVRMGKNGPLLRRRYVVRRQGGQFRMILSEEVQYNHFREPTEQEESEEPR